MFPYCRGETPRTPLAVRRLPIGHITVYGIFWPFHSVLIIKQLINSWYMPLNSPWEILQNTVFWRSQYVPVLKQLLISWWSAGVQLIHAIEFALKNTPKYCILAFLVCTSIKTAVYQLIISWWSADTYHWIRLKKLSKILYFGIPSMYQ